MQNYGFTRCAIAKFNSELGNPVSAVKKIKQLSSEAANKGVKILIFPELCLTGSTCQDLFFNPELLEATSGSLCEIVSSSLDKDILIVVGAPIKVLDNLYNCAVAIHKGEIKGIVPKQNISSTEKRWFTPYSTNDSIKSVYVKSIGKSVPFGNLIFSSSLGYNLGIEIGDNYDSILPPSSNLALAGANIIANISASSELVGKDEHRKEMIKAQSSKTISSYLYVSSGYTESTSDSVFGGSGYIFENGKELTSLNRFKKEDQIEIYDIDIDFISSERCFNSNFYDNKKNIDILNFETIYFYQDWNCFTSDKISSSNFYRKLDSNPFVPFDIAERNTVCSEVFSIQTTALAKRLDAINCKKVVLGVSGGLDSTLALLVCVEAFKKLNLDLSGIIGITMPGFGTTNYTYTNAINLCKQLGIGLTEIPIKDACLQHFKDIGHDPDVHDITYENVQARERTQILMDIANKEGALVVGTGDLSELMLGWCTYNGDHMSMYGVNANVPKTLIKAIIEWYGGMCDHDLSEILDFVVNGNISPELLPTDGKKVVQKTEDSVGPYEVIDFFIYNFLRKKYSAEKILFLAEVALSEKYSSEEITKYYNNFINRFFKNQFKRSCLPDGPRVGYVGVSSKTDLILPSDIKTPDWLKE